MARHHPWSSSNADVEVDIMPVSREQYTTRKPTVDAHFMRRQLIEKRKEDWKQVLNKQKTNKNTHSNRANDKNRVKRQVVEATVSNSSRLNDESHAAIREMRSARLSAKDDRATNAKAQSVREMRLARLKSSGSSNNSNTSSPSQAYSKNSPSLRKGSAKQRSSSSNEMTEPAQVSSTIREMRLAQGKTPVAKSYASSTPFLRVPKTDASSPHTTSASRRSSKKQSRYSPDPIKTSTTTTTPQTRSRRTDAAGNENTDTAGSENARAGGGNCTPGFVKTGELMGGCTRAANKKSKPQTTAAPAVGCGDLDDFFQSFFGEILGFCSGENDGDGSEQPPLGEEVSRSSGSEPSATMYIKKYGYDDL